MSRINRSRVAIDLPGKPELYNSVPLPDWETLGTITDAEVTGALVRNKLTGIYCRANTGVLRSLPQRKVDAALSAIPES